MRSEASAAIQEQSFKVELIMQNVSVDTVAGAIAGYFPGADIGRLPNRESCWGGLLAIWGARGTL